MNELYEKLKNIDEQTILKEYSKDQLNYPDIVPQTFDVTFEMWFNRIENWGEVRIYHEDPENKIKNKKITKNDFIKKINDKHLNRIFGDWDIYTPASINKLEFHRQYYGIDGKKYTEKFKIDIKLRPELQKAKKNWVFRLFK